MVTNEELIAALRDARSILHEVWGRSGIRDRIDELLARADEPQPTMSQFASAEDYDVAAGNPEVWVVLDEGGHAIYCASCPSQCHEHINDAIIEHDIPDAGKWSVRRMEPVEPKAATTGDGFYWLVELFAPEGNSLGSYHTGFTDLSLASRSTQDPYQAKRYATKDQAQRVADSLLSKVGIWKAVEHGFHTVPTPDAGAEPPSGMHWNEPFRQAVIEALIADCIYTTEHEINARKALTDLIGWEVTIALDPQVSSDAQALIDRGKAEAQPAIPDRWRPIETAPKDGRDVLLAWGGRTRYAKWIDNNATTAPWSGWSVPSLECRPNVPPTGWMPLPQPPKEGE